MRKSLFVIILLLLASQVFGQQKYALVIGNSNYTGISKLNNPVNDANDMETALKRLGFSVDKVLNGNLEQMETAVLNLSRRLGSSHDTYGFFFYAGHGVQSNGENYLIPVAADNIRTETQLRDRAVSLQFVLDTMGEAGNELNMVVLDACRDNPFGWARSGSRGLSVVGRAPSGSIVMYATGANSTAADGTGRNGLFTSHLLQNIKTPGLSVYDVFANTMGSVIDVTNGSQHPELSLRYPAASRAFFGSRPASATQPSPVQATPAQPAAPPPPAATQTAPAPPPERPTPADMVRINGGTFTMGSPANEPEREDREGPQRQVTISSFYMGRYEVTQKEYQEVMGTNPSTFKGDNLPVERVSWFDAVEYCNKRSQREGLTPAYSIDKTRMDANNLDGRDSLKWTVTWNRSANGYRLPTEAEWEYACRAGTSTPFSTGSNITTSQANYSINPYNNNTKAVGSFPANQWGLHDMHGNVSEWCWDWYGAYSSGAQTDPVGAVSDINRVSRGGSWSYGARFLRSAYRELNRPNFGVGSLGFRLVRQ